MLNKYDEEAKQLTQKLIDLGADIVKATMICEQGLKSMDNASFDVARDMLKDINDKANQVDQEVIRILALYGPEAKDLRKMVVYLKITNEIVGICGNIKTFTKNMSSHIESKIDFRSITQYVEHLSSSAFNAIKYAMKAIENKSLEEVETLYRKANVEETKSDDLYSLLEKSILTNVCDKIEISSDYIKVLTTMRKLERMADRSVNIGKMMLFVSKGGEIKVY